MLTFPAYVLCEVSMQYLNLSFFVISNVALFLEATEESPVHLI